MKKPICQLSETDGNVFCIIGRVYKILKDNGLQQKADEFRAKAMKSDSYDSVLKLCFEYVEVE